MSEEKLYAVKNDEGQWADSGHNFGSGAWATTNKAEHEEYAKHYGGHVITLIEEPEKVVLSEKQAESVELAHISYDPAGYISLEPYEELLMNAYVNGYTVAKEKKYLVYKTLGGKQKHELFAQAYRPAIFPDTITWSVGERRTPKTGVSAQFTEAEIEHYGLQDCEKKEVTDDEQ